MSETSEQSAENAEQIRDTSASSAAGTQGGAANPDLHGQAAEALSDNEEGVQPTSGG